VRSSFEESLGLEMVNDGDHRARRNRQEIAYRLLCLSHAAMDCVKNREMARFKSERADHFTELARGFQADLGQRETHRIPRQGHAGGVVRGGSD